MLFSKALVNSILYLRPAHGISKSKRLLSLDSRKASLNASLLYSREEAKARVVVGGRQDAMRGAMRAAMQPHLEPLWTFPPITTALFSRNLLFAAYIYLQLKKLLGFSILRSGHFCWKLLVGEESLGVADSRKWTGSA